MDGDSAKVIATNYEGMIKEGEELAALNPHIVVKVLVLRTASKLQYFSNKGIRTNCTLVFSAGQALLAAKAGLPMYLRLSADWMIFGNDGVGLVAQIVELYKLMTTRHKFLPLIRNTFHILQCGSGCIYPPSF